MTQTPRLEQVLEAFVGAGLGGVWTALPARVEVVDHRLCTVDAQPLVPRAYTSEGGERVVETLPMVVGCTVLFQGGQNGRLTIPPKKGDLGICLFTSCALDTLLGSGVIADPVSDRRNALSDAVFMHGFHHWNPGQAGSTPSADYDTEDVVLSAANDLLLASKSASQNLIRGSDFVTHLRTFVDAVALAATAGEIATAASNFKTWLDVTSSVLTPSVKVP